MNTPSSLTLNALDVRFCNSVPLLCFIGCVLKRVRIAPTDLLTSVLFSVGEKQPELLTLPCSSSNRHDLDQFIIGLS